MRTANISEKDCARYVCNYGFYRSFLHGEQIVHFSYRNNQWDIGLYDPSAVVALRINMRTIAERIFVRISELLHADPTERSVEEFQSYRQLYHRAVELDRLWANSVPLFERATL